MRAALRTFVIGAIVVNVVGLGSLSSAAHAHAAPAVGGQLALYRPAGVTSGTPDALGATYDGKGVNFVPTTVVQLTRDVTYNDADILAKESEEQLLFRDMQSDMVQQVMRRLAAVERIKPKAE